MMKKHGIFIQMIVWFIAILFLAFSLYQLHGDAKVINYTGIIRGGTQRLVKQEMYQKPDDALIEKLDRILAGLQSGIRQEQLSKLTGGTYQNRLKEMAAEWKLIKEEIMAVRAGKNPHELFTMSEGYFDLCDSAVSEAERISNEKLTMSLNILVGYLIFSSMILFALHARNKKTEQRMFYTDHVTGIDNQLAFHQRADLLLRKSSSYLVIYMDIDNFKDINDMYGYPFGDKILVEIAIQLKSHYPVVAHLDADNYLILSNLEENAEEHLRSFLSNALQEKFSENVSSSITYSMGIYLSSPHESAPIADILDKAEIAHKQCRSKKSATMWYNEELIDNLKRNSRIEKELNRAIEASELEVYLQPKFSLDQDKLVGAEALVRWNSSSLGRLMPDEFIPHLELNGTIYLLDFYMLEHVCAMIQQYKDIRKYCISINFSRITLNLDCFYQRFHEIVDSFDTPYNMLELEITEGAFQGISDILINVIAKLRNEGFHVSIDDFGSGYSSLNMLSDLPVDILKIDKVFLGKQAMTSEHEALITSIIQIAHHLHFDVICEGVETKEHVELLKKLECDYAQGYYYAKPAPVNQFVSAYLHAE